MKPIELQQAIEGKRVLYLALSKKAFEITGTEEKMFELRTSTTWIRSRLFMHNSPVAPKYYDYVCLTEGYGYKKYKLLTYKGIGILNLQYWGFSNGLDFVSQPGDFKILLGELVLEK